ncbi:unnamed protein product, partial [Schistosoma turkestanicum]
MYKNYTTTSNTTNTNDELSTLFHCMIHLFSSIEQDIFNLINYCEQLQVSLIMPLLITISHIIEHEFNNTNINSTTTQQNTTTNNTTHNTTHENSNPSTIIITTMNNHDELMSKHQMKTYIGNFLSRFMIETKRAFNRLI